MTRQYESLLLLTCSNTHTHTHKIKMVIDYTENDLKLMGVKMTDLHMQSF